MLSFLPGQGGQAETARRPEGRFRRLAQEHPILMMFGIAILSNAAGSVFSFFYNVQLILVHMAEHQKEVFWHVVSPLYNLTAYGLCVGLMVYLIWPVMKCRRQLRAGEEVPPLQLAFCRRRVVNLPFLQVCVNFMGWIPGAVVFPWLVCTLGGTHNAALIWEQFILSFVVSAVFTTVQTFFILEWFLMNYFYQDFFQDSRPADVVGVIRIPFSVRLILLWSAVAIMPLVAVIAVAFNYHASEAVWKLHWLTAMVGGVGALSGGLICWIVGRDLYYWVKTQDDATQQIAQENFDVRIQGKRPDDWGRLSDRFNDMAAALGRAKQVHETIGYIVGPEIRDEIFDRYPGGELGGEVQEVTVLFADIRGFTRRSAGEAPERVVELLNRFLTLAVQAVQDKRGTVNKFLGDGIMALFGAPRPRPDHADLAVASAQDLLEQLKHLNEDLANQGNAPLVVGIGIHTGPALVGCIGATLEQKDGRPRMRKELTAIGETVNLCQRIEQLTKKCGGPILISEQTRTRLRREVRLEALGPQEVPGSKDMVVVHRVLS
jgi:adenylate cyclase